MEEERYQINYWEIVDSSNLQQQQIPTQNFNKKKVKAFGNVFDEMRQTSLTKKLLDEENVNNIYQNQQQYQPPYQPPYQNNVQIKQTEYINPIVKNSKVYQKYFKDYDKDDNPKILKPKSIEELKQILFEQQMQKKRISEIKSTKMKFTNGTSNSGVELGPTIPFSPRQKLIIPPNYDNSKLKIPTQNNANNQPNGFSLKKMFFN